MLKCALEMFSRPEDRTRAYLLRPLLLPPPPPFLRLPFPLPPPSQPKGMDLSLKQKIRAMVRPVTDSLVTRARHRFVLWPSHQTASSLSLRLAGRLTPPHYQIEIVYNWPAEIHPNLGEL